MDEPTRPRLTVKICGLTRNADARLAQERGADFLGVVLSAGFARSVHPEAAAEVAVGTTLPRVAVLVDETPLAAAERASSIEASVIQLHGSEDRATVVALRELGDWSIWKAVRARELADIHRAVDELADVVDGLLVEGWREGLVGGAGVRVDLDSSAVRAAVPDPVSFVLAGGLTAESVGDAVARFAPDVVDVSSGVERSVGIKDPDRVGAFIRSAHAMRGRPRADDSE